jgi:hypothetical protein
LIGVYFHTFPKVADFKILAEAAEQIAGTDE